MSNSGIVATVKVRPDVANSDRPTRSRVQEAADCLRGRGFDVLHVGRFGVSVRADAPLFERELGVRLVASQTLVTAVQAREPNLARLVEGIEVAPPAEHFLR